MSQATSRSPGTRLPEGVVTFLFTDIEGSTKLLQRLGDTYGTVLSDHRALLRAAFSRYNGCEVDTQGDAFFVAFQNASEAAAAAVEAQRALKEQKWPEDVQVLVRMGIHTGEPVLIDESYVGIDLHRAARICSASHGGQVVVSEVTRRELSADHFDFKGLGAHRLKDLQDPERISQIVVRDLPQDFPPLRSLQPPTNVPHHVSTLVGRKVEKEELHELLLDDDVRLVTVTGPGGTGKTRVSSAAALEALPFFIDGVFFVDVTPVTTPELLPPAIADGLGGVPLPGDRSAVDALVEYIAGKHLLLLLDNFEQIVSAAGVVAGLLQRCPRLTVLVTTRIPLSIGGEREYPLQPLDVPQRPTRAAVLASEAGELFARRAAAAKPGFEITDANASSVTEVCRLLDGLPLALELAAARLKLLPVDSLVARLGDRFKLLTGGARDAPERHRTLRATIDWSYDLLTESESRFFRALAIFHGGASLDAIETVIEADVDAIDALTSLVNHSLIRQRETADGEIRFTMLQTIHDYALELLEKDARATELRERHAHYFVRIMVNAKENNVDHADLGAKNVDNFRFALSWLSERADSGSLGDAWNLVKLCGLLGRYWYTHAGTVEGSRWLERALAAVPETPHPDRALGMHQLGVLKEQQRLFDDASRLFYEALEDYQGLGDLAGEATCLNSLGVVARGLMDIDAAEEFFLRCVEIRRKIDDPRMSSAIGNLGIAALDRGEVDRAIKLFKESLELDMAQDDDWGVAINKNNLGVAYLEGGDIESAEPLILEGLRLCFELEEYDGVAESLEASAGVASAKGDAKRSGRLLGAAETLRGSMSTPITMADERRVARWTVSSHLAIGEEAYEASLQEGSAMTLEQAVDYAIGRQQQWPFEPIEGRS